MHRPGDGVILTPRGRASIDDYVIDIAWSADGQSLAAAGGEGQVYLANAASTPLSVRAIGAHAQGALAVAWQPGGTSFVSSGQDSELILWGADGSERKRWRAARAWTECLAYRPDGKLLASAAGKTVQLWDEQGERVHEWPQHASSVAAIAWDNSGRDLAAAINGAMLVHRIEPPRFELRQYVCNEPCLTAAWSPNGSILATGIQDGAVHFWQLSTGKHSQMRGYEGRVQLTSWSGNSRYLATVSGTTIVVWDFSGKGPEGTKPLQLTGHTDRIDCLAFQPGGVYLASGGRDWRVSLWQAGKSAAALDAQLTNSEVSVLRWSPDGRRIAAGERQGGLSIYELTGPRSKPLVTTAKDRVR